MRFLLLILSTVILISCKDDIVIKPKAQLRLDYSKAIYKDFNSDCLYSFQKNEKQI